MTETESGAPAKKMKLWNPALDDDSPTTTVDNCSPKSESTEEENTNSPMNGECMKPQMGAVIPAFLQSYMQFQFIRMQQHQMEIAMRQRLFSASMMPQMTPAPALTQRQFIPSSPQIAMPSSSKDTVSQPLNQQLVNPLVVNAVGGPPGVSENCCAVCGASFRLTGDLVQHMRNSHRRTRFKRKNERHAV